MDWYGHLVIAVHRAATRFRESCVTRDMLRLEIAAHKDQGMTAYKDYKPLTFHDATQRFADGSDTPRAYLERCLATIAAREPVVKAFTAINEAGARETADASTARWKAGKPLSPDRRHAHRHQGSARDQGHADADGLRGLQGQFPQARQCRGLGVAAGRRRHPGEDRHGRTGRRASGTDHQPVRSGAHAGRLVLGLGRRCRCAHGAGGDRHPGRRLDHPARRLLRQLRAEAHAGRASTAASAWRPA